MTVSAEPTRDDTADWVLPAARQPVTVAELETRIDEAMAVARAAEAAVVTVAASALESAEAASRAADLAKRASEAAARFQALRPGRRSSHADERLTRFSHRADRLGARLEQLQRSAAA